jgi:lipopolysaccharide biosynthesis glycosyltransferase
MNKKLVLQVYIQDQSKKDAALEDLDMFSFIKEMYDTSQHFAKKYAERVGADYYCVSSLDEWEPVSGLMPTYQRLKIYDLPEYDQIFYLDSDCIIKDDAPDIFEQLGPVSAACSEIETPYALLQAAKLNIDPEAWINAGVLYLNKNDILLTKDLVLKYLKDPPNSRFDQDVLSKAFFDSGVKFKYLDPNLWNPHHDFFGKYVDHYCAQGKKLWDISKYKIK